MDVGGPSTPKYRFNDSVSEHETSESGMRPLLPVCSAEAPHRGTVCAARPSLPFSRAWSHHRLDPRRTLKL